MKPSQLKRGSMLLMILLLSAILLTGLTMQWRSVSMAWEGATMTYLSKKDFYHVESLLRYGIGLFKGELIRLDQLNQNQLVSIYQGTWPKGNQQRIGRLWANYQPKEMRLELKAELFGNNQLAPIASAQALITTNAQDMWRILSWKNHLQVGVK